MYLLRVSGYQHVVSLRTWQQLLAYCSDFPDLAQRNRTALSLLVRGSAERLMNLSRDLTVKLPTLQDIPLRCLA